MVENGEGGSAKRLKPPNWADADNQPNNGIDNRIVTQNHCLTINSKNCFSTAKLISRFGARKH
ncbi:hypothetical protein [Rhodoblastus sp.]|uniref:hypothetical protein n=1 Tax=Rhodoblastus sp. TaxID=1962975 RepID=UPI003F9C7BE4